MAGIKLLIIRLSSIGDIVLTTPVIRCIKKKIPTAQIHFLCKPAFVPIVENNIYVDQLHQYKQGVETSLKAEQFDYIIDLQNNHRSRKLCRFLHAPCAKVHKLNLKKWLLVNFKINKLPKIHIVDRYLACTSILPVKIDNDHAGLDFFIRPEDIEKTKEIVPQPFICIAIGSQHATKQLSVDKLVQIIKKTTVNIALLGNEDDKENATTITKQTGNRVYNLCGKLTIGQSAAIIQQSQLLLCPDTGLMHIGAALNKKIISVWANTVPDFGMYPYMPDTNNFEIIENKNLKCRPCSKLGYKQCPKKHFRCIEDLNSEKIAQIINEEIDKY